MKEIRFSEEKNILLIQDRNISFTRIIEAISKGYLIDDQKHQNSEQYGHQRVLIICIENYIWYVPYVENEQYIFLKTAFPSRKSNKIYNKECGVEK